MKWVKWTLQIWNGMHLLSLLRKHCNTYVIKQIFIEYLHISMHWAKRLSDPNEKKKWCCHLGDYSLALSSKIKYWCVWACCISTIHSVFLVFLSGIFFQDCTLLPHWRQLYSCVLLCPLTHEEKSQSLLRGGFNSHYTIFMFLFAPLSKFGSMASSPK